MSVDNEAQGIGKIGRYSQHCSREATINQTESTIDTNQAIWIDLGATLE